ncbi:hypothetical protein D1007_44035 [Hordeum vulgare]|nr:hypothetical protein D1007_44035 [Hordeum vulgare]
MCPNPFVAARGEISSALEPPSTMDKRALSSEPSSDLLAAQRMGPALLRKPVFSAPVMVPPCASNRRRCPPSSLSSARTGGRRGTRHAGPACRRAKPWPRWRLPPKCVFLQTKRIPMSALSSSGVRISERNVFLPNS